MSLRYSQAWVILEGPLPLKIWWTGTNIILNDVIPIKKIIFFQNMFGILFCAFKLMDLLTPAWSVYLVIEHSANKSSMKMLIKYLAGTFF